MKAEKPCESKCCKCGSGDIARMFYKEGEKLTSQREKHINKFAEFMGYYWTSAVDHINHHCRCCGYEWQTMMIDENTSNAQGAPFDEELK